MDTINSPIKYSFQQGSPYSYKDYFEINPNTGAVRQIKAVDTGVAKKFELVIKVSIINHFHTFEQYLFKFPLSFLG